MQAIKGNLMITNDRALLVDKIEFEILYKYIQLSKDDVLELGVFRGGTTEFIVRHIDPKYDVWGIDYFLDPTKLEYIDYNPVYIKQNYLMEYDNVFFIVGDSVALGEKWRLPIGLLIVDADHSYDSTLRNMLLYGSHVIQEGYMLIHDYPQEGIMKAVAEFNTVCNDWKMIDELGSFVVLQKNEG